MVCPAYFRMEDEFWSIADSETGLTEDDNNLALLAYSPNRHSALAPLTPGQLGDFRHAAAWRDSRSTLAEGLGNRLPCYCFAPAGVSTLFIRARLTPARTNRPGVDLFSRTGALPDVASHIVSRHNGCGVPPGQRRNRASGDGELFRLLVATGLER